MSEITLTDANFEAEVLKSDVPVLVDFWAPWCGPCQMMGPVIEELAGEYEMTKAKIGKLNVDDNGTVAGQYRVMSIPTFLVFKGGQVVDQMVGGVPKEKLKAMLDKHL
ncbi:MAG TPA: thioredoxin [Candidatus Magasanikbacteria bacterium]|nr:MAG: thioredoxin [Candidatus Magasanikbacteria bacterium RIFOXYC2_FULL_39_8]HAT03285.1 thioredoxin [Candidatus Magasanikbacteria bacterium]